MFFSITLEPKGNSWKSICWRGARNLPSRGEMSRTILAVKMFDTDTVLQSINQYHGKFRVVVIIFIQQLTWICYIHVPVLVHVGFPKYGLGPWT